MGPKNSRGRSKVEKKKNKEGKVLPLVVDITVNLPDETHVILKGISTDRIVDVRRLLSVNTLTCAITNFSLSHEVRGRRLKDTVDVSALKPCVLTLVHEDYNGHSASAHIRRLLDIVACTTCFGPSPIQKFDAKESNSEVDKTITAPKSPKPPINGKELVTPSTTVLKGSSKNKSVEGEGDVDSPCPKLGSFYDFFSLSHIAPPLQCIRRSIKQRSCNFLSRNDDFFSIDVKLCNGKLLHIVVCGKGFYSVGKLQILCHNLVDLLRQLNRSFDNAYENLMKAFSDRNKFGNLPYGFRANTWLTPPVTSQLPFVFSPLPVEDETWGGNGGGLGRDGDSDLIPWASEFACLASMPCKTAEERQVRDRRALLLHSLFVDISIFKAIAAVRKVMENLNISHSVANSVVLCCEAVGDLIITVVKDTFCASSKIDTKIDGFQTIGVDETKLVERNLLRGITADENAAAHDTVTLGVVNVRYCGYIAFVKVKGTEKCNMGLSFQNIELFDQPEGGTNALNINSLRFFLHKRIEQNKSQSPLAGDERLNISQDFVIRLIEDSFNKLQLEAVERDAFVRWELGACWIQHLQDQKSAEKDKKLPGHMVKREMKTVGIGKPLKVYKKDEDENSLTMHSNHSKSSDDGIIGGAEKGVLHSLDDHLETSVVENEVALKNLLSDAAFLRLKQSETGLHCKSLQELVGLIQKYYNEVALPKLVADFGSLELSPVDGRTLTDFMHTRGLRMHSLGNVVKLSEKLSHVQSLCINEMIVRAFKHILRAVISATPDTKDLAASIASSLNLMLGTPESGVLDQFWSVHPLIRQWLEVFLMKRFEWDATNFNYNDVRKIAILRELCNKVGIELVPRDFDLNCSNPFQKADVVSLVPVHKQAVCSSADGRQLLELSKTALDKGKLEEAVSSGTKALSKLVAVCGPYHRMTAGAYSLLAVVLYHTGDFNQATIYQQKALDINERELGLDHPDTMKSYGDLAVFYYRLQHTELAIKYVRRALYLLHIICGPSHPNTAATYINVAMMEEGLGNVHTTLRYLHKALKCNQKLLGSDHIQTAASYHAIAIALSLMDAYPLSVQHEQTTLRILRAKLGPDDLRTQDAAAWLEYFESKTMEQQEAARNEIRKPDASIASKGHLSVSDLLDYINPITAAKGKDCILIRRKKYTAEIGNFIQNGTLKISEESGTDVPTEAAAAQNNKQDHGIDRVVNFQTEDPPFQSMCPAQHDPEPILVNQTPKKDVVSEEDGWQSVQRPRSRVAHWRRIRQRRPNLSTRVFNHQQNDAFTGKNRQRNTCPYGSYYLSKSSPGGTKFGCKGLKTVAYRVKSAPPSTKTITTHAPPNVSEVMGRPSKPEPFPKRRTIVKLGDYPSYKEVVVAPAGSISNLARVPQYDDDVPRIEIKINDVIKNSDSNISTSDSADVLKDELNVVGDGEIHSSEGVHDSNVIQIVSESSSDDVHDVIEEGSQMNNCIELLSGGDSSENLNTKSHSTDRVSWESNTMSDSFKSELGETDPSENLILDTEIEPLAPNSVYCSDFASKLSASAVPFNPAPQGQIPMTIVPVPWTMNMYPSPPATPNMIHPLPYMYPPYSQPQSVSTSPGFYPNQFRYMCPNGSEFVPTNVWPASHPLEPLCYPVSDTQLDAIALDTDATEEIKDASLGSKGFVDTVQEITELGTKTGNSKGSCKLDSKSECTIAGDTKCENMNGNSELDPKSENSNGSDEVDTKLENMNGSSELDIGTRINGAENEPKLNKNSGGENVVSMVPFNILLRGQKNRKHNLRMPVSLLNRRPHGSHSFKVIYSRVVKGGGKPICFSSCEDTAAV